jgi:hypothetical protein
LKIIIIWLSSICLRYQFLYSLFWILAENAPPKSKAEMQAMAELDRFETVKLLGTLGMYEEYPEPVTQGIQNFI